MALKDWHIYKKGRHHNVFEAVHKKQWKIIDIMKTTNSDYIFSAEIDQGEDLEQLTFKTKSAALKYAKAYMKKN